jgi:hypothetical protein
MEHHRSSPAKVLMFLDQYNLSITNIKQLLHEVFVITGIIESN